MIKNSRSPGKIRFGVKKAPFSALLFLPLLALSSCGFFEPTVAILWTDRPEFALYAEYFNSSQDVYKIETRYFDSPTQKLGVIRDSPARAALSSLESSFQTRTGRENTPQNQPPDIVVGSWLKSTTTRTHFRPIDPLFKDSFSREAFYSGLLSLGKIEDKQYLLPVSFNIPAIVFARDSGDLLSSLFVISLEEIKEVGKAYNTESGGAYTRMGFSPSWNDEFLFVIATLSNTSFREANPLAWDSAALEKSVNYIREWIADANTDIRAEDEFSFKYFFVPKAKLAISGRILFTYMESHEFFTLAEEQRNSLNFRWLAGGKDGIIPLAENTTYLGLCKWGKAKKAAGEFTRWFFREDTQRFLLEQNRRFRINETLFGIGNGFSGLRTVTEQIYPRYYPGLLGHMPPEASLTPPNILPWNWIPMKQGVILPYLHDRIRIRENAAGMQSLEWLLADWLRINRDL